LNKGNDPEDRFGMPDSAIRAACEAHSGILRGGMYVPTREEVATWPAETLTSILMDWMWESPSELIPSNEQIAEVLAILEARPDASELSEPIAECRDYLQT
jgi:hypothetical protein